MLQVCGQGSAPAVCCVAVNLGNSQENFIEGQLDIFSGGDLGECYNFEVGTLASSDQFGKGTFINDVTQPGKGYGATSNRLFSYFPPFFPVSKVKSSKFFFFRGTFHNIFKLKTRCTVFSRP